MKASGKMMNVTLVAAVTLLLIWLVLLFTSPVITGAVNLLYAGATVLFARRVLVGAPQFRS